MTKITPKPKTITKIPQKPKKMTEIPPKPNNYQNTLKTFEPQLKNVLSNSELLTYKMIKIPQDLKND